MNDRCTVIWFWQRIISPHMAGLVAALARQGCEVTYVAEQEMSSDRAQQGWNLPGLGDAHLELAPTPVAVRALVARAPASSIHICQGIRSNGLVSVAQGELARRGLRQWIVMETVDDSGWRGFLKRFEYWRLLRQCPLRLDGLLSTGHQTPIWVAARGVPANRVFPFAYFLPDIATPFSPASKKPERFRFIFVGQFIERKRLELLIAAMAALQRKDVELVVVGSGLLENALRSAAEVSLPGRIRWIGKLPVDKVPAELAMADCLVLPSRHDGWGAVVSEALMVGTPAICSDHCGAAGVVRASGQGGVFRSGDQAALTRELAKALDRGRLSFEERAMLADWAKCLGGEAGASYLRAILDHANGQRTRPAPPWEHT